LLLQPRRLEDEMFQDLQFGWRMLARNKTFTFIAILSLAAGIGVNTAIFSAVNALLLRPLPYAEPERLVWVEEALPQATDRFVAGAPLFDLEEHSPALARVAAHNTQEFTLTRGGGAERVGGYNGSAGVFPSLRAPLLVWRHL